MDTKLKAVERVNGKLVLGDGEVTGHQHTIRSPKAQMFEIDPDTRVLLLPEPVLLRHERGDVPAEHRDVQLPSGEPTVTYKRQYQPNGWERVQD